MNLFAEVRQGNTIVSTVNLSSVALEVNATGQSWDSSPILLEGCQAPEVTLRVYWA